MYSTHSTHTYINVRNKNKIKKSGVRHQLFRISDYKHTINIYRVGGNDVLKNMLLTLMEYKFYLRDTTSPWKLEIYYLGQIFSSQILPIITRLLSLLNK
jgi:hypothetical protein